MHFILQITFDMAKITSSDVLICGVWVLICIKAGAVTSLACHRCFVNVCNHQYCNLVLQMLTEIGALDKSLQSCPPSSCPSKPQLSQFHPQATKSEQCGPTAVCGHHVIYLNTSYINVEPKNPTSDAQIPVFVQVTHRIPSSIHIFGCVNSSQPSCPLYPEKVFSIEEEDSDGQDESVKVTRNVTVFNTASTCCQCTTDSCNKNKNFTIQFSEQCSLITQSLVLVNGVDAVEVNHESTNTTNNDNNSANVPTSGTIPNFSFNNIIIFVIILLPTMAMSGYII